MLCPNSTPATISTGGAANELRVPPMEIFTSRTPRARYLACSAISRLKICGPSNSAAMVIAAGSVINEPSNGTAANPSQACVRPGTGVWREIAWTASPTACRIGRDAATTMTTKTNSGSA